MIQKKPDLSRDLPLLIYKSAGDHSRCLAVLQSYQKRGPGCSCRSAPSAGCAVVMVVWVTAL